MPLIIDVKLVARGRLKESTGGSGGTPLTPPSQELVAVYEDPSASQGG